MEGKKQGNKTGLEVYINRFGELSEKAKEKIERFMGRLMPGEEITIAPIPEQPSGKPPLDVTDELVAFGRAGQSPKSAEATEQ